MFTFTAMCTLALLGHASFSAPCRFDDLPTAGYNNRFALTIFTAQPIPSAARFSDYVDVNATVTGGMTIAAVLLGNVTMIPDQPSIRSLFMNGSFEVRPQNVTVTAIQGQLTILIDEPVADFNGSTPSAAWLARHRLAFTARRQGN